MGENKGMVMRLWKHRTYIISFLTTIFSAYLVYKVPIKLSFIPKERVYEFSLSIYALLITFLFGFIEWLVNWYDEKKSIVNIEFSLSETKYLKQDIIYRDFNADIANVYAKIHLDCYAQNVIHGIIKIKLPTKVDVQAIETYAKYYKIDSKERIVYIELKKLINNNMEKRFKDDTEIGFQVIKNDKVVNSDIETVIDGVKRSVNFTTNKLKFTE